MASNRNKAERFHIKLMKARTAEQYTKIIQTEQAHATNEFPRQLKKLEDLLLKYNPFTILATFAFIDLTYLPKRGRPMTTSEDIDQYHIEVIQALILRHPESEFKKRPHDPPQFQKLRDLASSVGYLHSAKDFGKPSSQRTEPESLVSFFQFLIRGHTKGVRNWGYEDQTFVTLRQLYAPLEDSIQKQAGIRVADLIDATRSEVDAIGQRLQDHCNKVRKVMAQKTTKRAVSAYLESFNDRTLRPADVETWVKDKGWSFENVRVFLFHRTNSYLLHVFAFELDAFVKRCSANSPRAKEVILRWTLELGDLNDYQQEHFFLANPVWRRPLMRVAENILFWPIPTLFHGFCFGMVEELIAGYPELRTKLLKRRGDYLEEFTSQLFQKKFPRIPAFRGSLWFDEMLRKNGENDLLLIFDSMALIVEEKAGAINAVARRGGASIQQEIKQLITEPAEQAHRFAQFLQKSPRHLTLSTKSGQSNKIDLSGVSRYLCLGVTFERFGILATQTKELQAAGLAKSGVPPVPMMAVPDLELALELFQSPFEFLHYLTRRLAFEQKRRFLGDELDLMAFYIRTGFSKKCLPEPHTPLMISGLARELDNFFMNRAEDSHAERKPSRNLSDWWRQITEAIEKKQVSRRYELGCILLDMPDEEQDAFEKQFKALCERTRRNVLQFGESVQAIWTSIESDLSCCAIIAAPVKSPAAPNRSKITEQLAQHAMKETNTNQAVVILVDVERGHWPYSGIYLLDKG